MLKEIVFAVLAAAVLPGCAIEAEPVRLVAPDFASAAEWAELEVAEHAVPDAAPDRDAARGCGDCRLQIR